MVALSVAKLSSGAWGTFMYLDSFYCNERYNTKLSKDFHIFSFELDTKGKIRSHQDLLMFLTNIKCSEPR